MASLAETWRPRNFDELEGNAMMKVTLLSKLNLPEDQMPQVHLVVGPKGCGKTTIAYLIKNHLQVDDFEFYEIDASDESGGVAQARQLKKDIQLAPMVGKYRMWFIDEVHKMTKPAQEAMLKMLEKPPKHAIFVLATTDPQMLKGTLKDRCQEWEVKPLSNKEIFDYLSLIVETEGKPVPDEVLKLIATQSEGHPRAAIKQLEKIIDLPPNAMKEMAQRVGETEATTKQLIEALINGESWPKVSKLLQSLNDEPETLRRAILGYTAAMLLNSNGGPKDRRGTRAALIVSIFSRNLYDSGRPGLIAYCYDVATT